MSGTSLDGVDVAFVRIAGSGREINVEVLAAGSIEYDPALRDRLHRISDPAIASDGGEGAARLPCTQEVTRLHAELATVYADAIRTVASGSGIDLEGLDAFSGVDAVGGLDAVGSHGQTVYHDPEAGSTLQLGDPARLAQLMGVTVVGDFRQGDMALGGQGAPLVPYMDWAMFTHPTEHRVLLNLGGIANLTVLPAGCDRDHVIAFDSGPANMLLDSLAQNLLGLSMDLNGEEALLGFPDHLVVDGLLEHPYFRQKPPKSTGRELFNAAYLADFLSRTTHLDTASRFATAAQLTIRSIADAIRDNVDDFSSAGFIPSGGITPSTTTRVLVAGGGVHNQAIMSGLSDSLSGASVEPLSVLGFDPDAKEAVCFAILAHEALNGVATGMPSVTGARGRAFSGKICPPGNHNAREAF